MNCGSSDLEQFIDLGNQPNGNVFLSAEHLHQEQMFSCIMLVCTQCWQVQIKDFPPVDTMFANHPYISGLNQPVVAHFENLARATVSKFSMPENSLVLDIGANDGTLLKKFRDLGMRVLGIDPCQQVQTLSRKAGITVLQTFWNQQSGQSMQQLGIYPDLITATAVFYHVEDIHSFIQGLKIVMKQHTVFCVQCVYLKDVIEKVQFDHFYHEHTMIHAIGPLKRVFSAHGLRLLDVDFYPIHGGSFVLYVGREDFPAPTSEKIATAINEEEKAGLYQLQTYRNFAMRVQQNKHALVSLLTELKQSGQRVFGLGAPVKGNTLLNYYGVGTDLIGCLTEVNPEKTGRYAPGSHIPVISEHDVDKQPDYYLVLSWNFLDYLLQKYADYLDNGGHFIVPHPKVHVIGRNGAITPHNEVKQVL